MRPLGEWTDGELVAELEPGYREALPARSVLAELLRRERERCAGVALATTVGMVGFVESDRMEFAVRNMAKLRDTIASRIRGLQ